MRLIHWSDAHALAWNNSYCIFHVRSKIMFKYLPKHNLGPYWSPNVWCLPKWERRHQGLEWFHKLVFRSPTVNPDLGKNSDVLWHCCNIETFPVRRLSIKTPVWIYLRGRWNTRLLDVSQVEAITYWSHTNGLPLSEAQTLLLLPQNICKVWRILRFSGVRNYPWGFSG